MSKQHKGLRPGQWAVIREPYSGDYVVHAKPCKIIKDRARVELEYFVGASTILNVPEPSKGFKHDIHIYKEDIVAVFDTACEAQLAISRAKEACAPYAAALEQARKKVSELKKMRFEAEVKAVKDEEYAALKGGEV